MRDSISQARSLTYDNIHYTRVLHTILQKVTLNYLCIADLRRKCSFYMKEISPPKLFIVSLRTGLVVGDIGSLDTRPLSKTSEPLSFT